MKQLIRLVACALLLMVVPVVHAQSITKDALKVYAQKAGDIAVKTTDFTCNYQLWAVGFLLTNYLGYSYDLPRAVDLFAKASLLRSLVGLVTGDSKRVQDAQQGTIMASLMAIALRHCPTTC